MAERQPSKLHVASSNLVSRSTDPGDGWPADHDDPAASAPAALREAALRLRTALDRTIRQTPNLATDSEALSLAYRSGTTPPGAGSFVHDDRTAEAYAAARMPATFGAVGRALLEGARSLPAFRPGSMVDLGAGTGSATWAATAVWPSLERATLIDAERAMVGLGQRIAAAGRAPRAIAAATWQVGPLGTADPPPQADLVVAAYVLGELDPTTMARVVESAWVATLPRGALIIVEPGSRAGFARILAARDRLIGAGATIVAPCPGNVSCPVRDPEWCHFLARLDRSPLQRNAKAASRSWEDEPYSYVVAARTDAERSSDPPSPAPRVVLGRPRQRPGRIELRVCGPDGLTEPTISRRHGPAWRAARDLAWGDRIDGALADHLQPAAGPAIGDASTGGPDPEFGRGGRLTNRPTGSCRSHPIGSFRPRAGGATLTEVPARPP